MSVFTIISVQLLAVCIIFWKLPSSVFLLCFFATKKVNGYLNDIYVSVFYVCEFLFYPSFYAPVNHFVSCVIPRWPSFFTYCKTLNIFIFYIVYRIHPQSSDVMFSEKIGSKLYTLGFLLPVYLFGL